MPKSTASDTFLTECEPFFMDGAHTVAEFARRTQKVLRDAVEEERYFNPLVEALGFSEVVLSAYSYPAKLQDVADHIRLGVRIKFDSKMFDSAIYRYWNVEEKETGIGLRIWIKDRTTTGRLGKKINELRDEIPGAAEAWSFETRDYAEYHIRRSLENSEIAELGVRIDEFITYCLAQIKKVGGVKSFLD